MNRPSVGGKVSRFPQNRKLRQRRPGGGRSPAGCSWTRQQGAETAESGRFSPGLPASRPAIIGSVRGRGSGVSQDPGRSTGRRTVPVGRCRSVPSFLVTTVMLALVVAAGAGAIVMIRKRALRQADDRGDWERTLVEYKNLRDEGVLSEEEFRKIRTLVEPRMRSGMPELRGRQQPSPDPRGPQRREEQN